VNDFKCQINYVKAIKYLLNCCQRLGKFNTIVCAKYHNCPFTPLLTWFIRANTVTVAHKRQFSRNREGLF